ncbi:hypothetical protein B0A48_11938 [Cryoendolithus antarcticus]|uniref:Epoxide hydrolase N-terminal domain-containing protein n=1 Tax=Cryoendolithus antarcticus TaxID=1507870 RepID=A0A1V8STM0_9PEZI|nr:hypothetical protein B0A48_11938 [Cryoendolithus antarcticus]
MSFSTLPQNASLKPKPFKAHVSDDELKLFTQLVKLSPIGPSTFENETADVKDFNHFGVSRAWLSEAKKQWETSYDWRKTEDRINSYPNFTVPIEEDGFTFDVHFIALFSAKKDAAPLMLLHGWPGSFLEFVDTLDLLEKKYTPETLPFHVIVPSLPGYGYSSGPSTKKNFNTEGIASVCDKLMTGLGFSSYISQGGDIGSFVSRVLGATAPACKAVHINLAIGLTAEGNEVESLSQEEKIGLGRYGAFGEMGNAYARMHGTRPSTIGLVLSSNPIAQLAWIGEKFLQWTDVSPPIASILDSVTLYWFTQSFARAIFPYRQFFAPPATFFHNEEKYFINKPMGYSWHPKELAPVPKAWVAKTGNLVWYKGHEKGGHFASMELPEQFLDDMESFVGEVWPTVQK